uniref:Uncharacterized protein n=1 Tax=Rhizophora mucronata TaxID=61149 RepID=A0A2P2QYQ7_RHIMU
MLFLGACPVVGFDLIFRLVLWKCVSDPYWLYSLGFIFYLAWGGSGEHVWCLDFIFF